MPSDPSGPKSNTKATIENREHFRTYARGLIGRIITERSIGIASSPLEVIVSCATHFWRDLVSDAGWVGKEVGVQFAAMGIGSGLHMAGKYLDQAQAGSGVPFARAGKALLEDLATNLLRKLQQGG